MTHLGAMMRDIRSALAAIPPDVSHVVGRPPAFNEILTPPTHALALDPDSSIIVGARGAGKSFWASVLADDETRSSVEPFYPRLQLKNVQVRPGFVDQALETAVSRDTLDELATSEIASRRMWLVLAIRASENVLGESTFESLAEGLVTYSTSEARELRLRHLDRQLASNNIRLVIVFDALDRLAGNWNDLRVRTSTLLESLLTLRAYRNINFKLFMRPEQLDTVPLGFTDLSKLKAGAFDLRWSVTDLYALAYSWLANTEISRSAFEALLLRLRLPASVHENRRVALPASLLKDSDVQARVFTAIAGPYMGSDARRGKTYPWLPKHLSDTKGQVMPRSFLTALGAGARDDRLPRAEHALSIGGIKHGVSSASVLRIDQLKDEYGWIELALEPLAGQEVPCPADAIYDRWDEAGTVEQIQQQSEEKGYLPPAASKVASSNAAQLLLSAMMEIGVVEIRPDGRVNIPDLFRIAALMLRRGGPRPLRIR